MCAREVDVELSTIKGRRWAMFDSQTIIFFAPTAAVHVNAMSTSVRHFSMGGDGECGSMSPTARVENASNQRLIG